MKNRTLVTEPGRVGLYPTIFIVILLLGQTVCSRIVQDTVNNTKVGSTPASPAVHLINDGKGQVIVDNGIIQVTFSSPQGLVTRIKFQGIDNALDPKVRDSGYWDLNWSDMKTQEHIDMLKGTKFSIVTQTADQVEISFSRTWDSSQAGLAPLNVDKRYIIRRGSSGLYIYAILERLKGWPEVKMDQIRVVFKLKPDMFQFMAISDDRQRLMPTAADRETTGGRAQQLDYKEAVRLIKPQNPAFKGEVDDKYQYSMEDKDNKVHGWISSNPRVGFWMITPSDEYRCGGPVKQDLTSHVASTTINMFISTHYAGEEMDVSYKSVEPWKKIFGPVFVYLNSVPPTANQLQLWKDAKNQMLKEVGSWPYDFVASVDFPKAGQRGTVKGQLLVKDSFNSTSPIPAKNAYVGLSPPGQAGSWQTQTKGYQFWTQADVAGRFTIEHVRPGTYSLYAWVPGFIGDFKYNKDINIAPGAVSNIGPLVYNPPRKGPTLWEIGIPDRSAAEFFIPNPYPDLQNKLYLNHPNDKFRQYGLWRRYAEIYPKDDLVFTVGSSDYRKDWFYAHISRKVGNAYKATTWRIVFNLKATNPNSIYTLQLGIASATYADIVVRVNNPNSEPAFSTGRIGKDNAIARHGIHGLYKYFGINVPGKLLKPGSNTIYLTQANAATPFEGVMYDYIRLEGPPRA